MDSLEHRLREIVVLGIWLAIGPETVGRAKSTTIPEVYRTRSTGRIPGLPGNIHSCFPKDMTVLVTLEHGFYAERPVCVSCLFGLQRLVRVTVFGQQLPLVTKRVRTNLRDRRASNAQVNSSNGGKNTERSP
ncbi:hypothetical protein BS47DRAFT_717864 [Hydnum rufescens UP504]|uniref:Uncharacterized protein n=1 Tax=Hydnum rufescens UP504 TaxID=1448309 RepID=A0A9P6DYK7_9AGAM|nr:hypothetical protein BS47DRAFT_717864 [Hydnum rufescens UP504]